MSAPVFIDAAYAADMLHVPPDTILDWISSGRLRTYGGRSSNPFLRTADVAALAAEMGVGGEGEPPKRTKGPLARVQTRLTADSRWKDITPEDIREWAVRAEPTRRQAARKVATEAVRALQTVLHTLDEVETRE